MSPRYDNARKGKVGELMFELASARHRLVASTPGHPCSYDYVVDNLIQLSRVQVKSASTRYVNKDGTVRFAHILVKTNVHYTPGSFDYWVLVVEECSAIYIIPFHVLEGRGCATTKPYNPEQDKYATWRDAWWQLDGTGGPEVKAGPLSTALPTALHLPFLPFERSMAA